MKQQSAFLQRLQRAKQDRRILIGRWSLFQRRKKDTHILNVMDKEWVYLRHGDIRSRDYLHIDDLQETAMRRALWFKIPMDYDRRLQEFSDLTWLDWKFRKDLSEIGANVCFERVSMGRAYRVKLYVVLPPEDKVEQVWDGSFVERTSSNGEVKC